MKYATLRFLTFIADFPGWLIAFLFYLFWGKKWSVEYLCLVITLKEDSWPVRTWYRNWGGTTLGHAILMNPNVRDVDSMLFHESRHVEQFETFSIVGLLLGIVLTFYHLYLPAIIVALSWSFVNMLMAMVVGWLRGEGFYRGSFLEEAAYDAQELRERKDNGKA
jgi:hypothetical protein